MSAKKVHGNLFKYCWDNSVWNQSGAPTDRQTAGQTLPLISRDANMVAQIYRETVRKGSAAGDE